MFWLKSWLIFKTTVARLRFLAIVAVIGLVIVKWDSIIAIKDKLFRPAAAEEAAAHNVEYYCPMHLQIVRDKPDKCPICGMPLSKRNKGETTAHEAWPAGVVDRVQLTPFRQAAAGIQTATIGYQSLSREITAAGFVEFAEPLLKHINAWPTGKSRIDKLFINETGRHVHEGDPLVELYSPNLIVTVQNLLDAQRSRNLDLQRMARERLQRWGIQSDQIDEILRTGKPITQLTIRSPISGHIIRKYQVEGDYVEEGARLYDVADLSTVWIEAQVYEDEMAFMKTGLPVQATTKAFPNHPFPGKLTFIHPHLDAATRTLKVRLDMKNPKHELKPGMYATVAIHVPAGELPVLNDGLAEDLRNQTAGDLAAHALAQSWVGPAASPGFQPLLATALRSGLMQRGLGLAVPERAVIDTGNRKIVYREVERYLFEGVEVQLGPRCGDFYPVIRGLKVGDQVATTGSFLIDAETRLTGSAASTYFGASGGPKDDRHSAVAPRPSTPPDEDARVQSSLAMLSGADRKAALAQGYCPIRPDKPLGSMLVPYKITLNGQTLFLCCGGCEGDALENPEQTIRKVEELRARVKGGTPK